MILTAIGIAITLLGIFLLIYGLIETPDFEQTPDYSIPDYSIDENIDEWSKVEETRKKEKERKVDFGGVVMIGPIPIVFGSDKKAAMLAMILAILLMILAILTFAIYLRW